MCIFAETANCVRLRSGGAAGSRGPRPEDIYWCDHAFGPEAPQDQVYYEAVAPICASVLEGYNGAVIAYGQTGSGKTFTIIGDSQNRGIIPRAVTSIFDSLQTKKHWCVEVCVLEIYNERARDLLAQASGVTQVEIHEVMGPGDGVPSFHCPDATHREVRNPEEALTALFEGLRRRETARTDMNHNSSRSHLIFTLNITQSDDALKATLRGRLHLVDLAGCERLKRSMGGVSIERTPRDRDMQRREAGAINKSLTQLALVIYRLTQPASVGLRHVPYRDSMLTRLLADSFGGSSKTCLIINCSPLIKDREETRCALEFGKRANLVKNVAEINIEMQQEPSDIIKALVAKELADLRREKEEMRGRLNEAVHDAMAQQRRRVEEVQELVQENQVLEKKLEEISKTVSSSNVVNQSEVFRLYEQNLLLRQCLEQTSMEAAHAQSAKLAMQQQLVTLLNQFKEDNAANPSQLETARAMLAQPEEQPPAGFEAWSSNPNESAPGSPATEGAGEDGGEVTATASVAAKEAQARARQREARLAKLEEDTKVMNVRWTELLNVNDSSAASNCSGTPLTSPGLQAKSKGNFEMSQEDKMMGELPEDEAARLLLQGVATDGASSAGAPEDDSPHSPSTFGREGTLEAQIGCATPMGQRFQRCA